MGQSVRSTPYVQLVKVGAIYTDGEDLWEVIDVSPLGFVSLSLRSGLRPVGDGIARGKGEAGLGIDAFRRRFWLVRDAW